MRWLRSGFAWLVAMGIGVGAGWAQDCPLSYASRVQTVRVTDSVTIAFVERGTGPTTLLFVHGLGAT